MAVLERVTVDLSPALAERLDKNWELLLITREEPLDAGVQHALSNYVELFELVKSNLKPQFSVKEIIFLMDILNGLLLTSDSAVIAQNIDAEIEDAVKYENTAAMHGFSEEDVSALIGKLKAMPLFDRWVLLVSIKGLWLDSYVVEDDELESRIRSKLGHVLVD